VDRLEHALGPDGDDEEVLDVHAAAGVQAAGEDVDHGQRKGRGPQPRQFGDAPVQRSARRRRRGPADGQRRAEDRVRPEPGQLRRAVELPQQRIDPGLVVGVVSAQGGIDVGAHVVDRRQHAQPGEHRRVTVAELVGLEAAGGGPRRYGGAARRPICQADVDLDRGAAARVEYLPAGDADDRAHERAAPADARMRTSGGSQGHRWTSIRSMGAISIPPWGGSIRYGDAAGPSTG
jgi:hypothetical protein